MRKMCKDSELELQLRHGHMAHLRLVCVIVTLWFIIPVGLFQARHGNLPHIQISLKVTSDKSIVLIKPATVIRSLASNMVHRSTTTPSAGTEAARHEHSHFVEGR
jgi:hypothetical protein